MANWEFFDNQTPESTTQLADDLRAGKPTSGRRRGADSVCSFKEVSRVLAGFPDGRADEGVGAGPASLRGPSGWPARAAGPRRQFAGRAATAEHQRRGHRPTRSAAEQRAPSAPTDHARPTTQPAASRTAPEPADDGKETRWQRRSPRPHEVLGRPTAPGRSTTYERNGGYQALREGAGAWSRPTSCSMTKDSGLRGRGGAGFPTGMKWGFLPPPDGGPRYLVVNADESEPGTCKDIPLMMAAPQFLIEGVVITSFAIGCNHAFIYLRGEVAARLPPPAARGRGGVRRRATSARTSSARASTSRSRCTPVPAPTSAARRPRCSTRLEGRRGQPRLKPPFPAVAGLYARPDRGQQRRVDRLGARRSCSTAPTGSPAWAPRSPQGFGIFSLSGHVKRPGQYEAPLGITLRELLDMAGGMRDPHKKLKFWTPGGSSTPLFTAEHLDIPLDFESVAAAGSMLGTRALQIFDETTCVVRAVDRWTEFYKHESCGKCTPCREGTCWLKQILSRLEHGQGTEEDLEKLLDICDNILGRAFCALGDGATSPITSSIQYFREEYEAPTCTNGGCPFDRDASVAVREGRRARMTTTNLTTSPSAGGNAVSTGGNATPPAAPPVTLTIDGVEVSVPKGTLVIRAAEQIGVQIPRFCDHPLLEPVGACRQCLVDVAMPGPDGTLRPDAEAAGLLHHRRCPRAWRSRPSSPPPWPTRRSRASWSSCSSTTRWTARSATRAASARCRTRR